MESKQLNKPLIIRIMTMIFNILQGKFNLVFDFGTFSYFEIKSHNKEGKEYRTKDMIRSYTNFTSAWLKEK